jgi:hypothetical protein
MERIKERENIHRLLTCRQAGGYVGVKAVLSSRRQPGNETGKLRESNIMPGEQAVYKHRVVAGYRAALPSGSRQIDVNSAKALRTSRANP